MSPAGLLWISLLLPLAFASHAAAASLSVDVGSPQTFTTEDLLARPDATTISVPLDATYGRPMAYRAVPLRALLGIDALPDGGTLNLTAADGFVSTLPADLLFPPAGRGATPWLAVEPPDAPWPPTPQGNATGPFYLVWLDPAASGVTPEQWPYAVASIGLVSAATVRWPALLVGDDVPADAPEHAGQVLVLTQCMVCHKVDGAGDATVGPDLGHPHSPTEYFQPWALKAYIRHPASLRSWPDMAMPGFSPDALSDADIDAITAYLAYVAKRRE